MKLLISFLKFLQSLCLLLIPILIFYCILASIKIAIIDQFSNELGNLLSPISMVVNILDQTLGNFVNLFKGVADFEIKYNSMKLDFTHIVAAVALFCFYHILGIINNMVQFLQQQLKKLKKIKDQRKAEELLELKILDEVGKYKIYGSSSIILRLKQNESNLNYLTCNNNPNLVQEDPIQQLLSLISENAGIRHKDLEKNGDYYIVFKTMVNSINFCFELKAKIENINEACSKNGGKISSYVFADNFLDKANKSNDFAEIEKLFDLTGTNEIFVGETFKKYYECFSTDTNCKFISKGLYSMHDKNEVEIFALIKKK